MKPLHGCRLEGPPPVTGGYDGEARFTTIRANLTETFAVHDAHSEFTGEIDRLWVSNVDTASGTRGTAASLLQEEDAHGNDPPFHQPPPPRHSNDVVDGRQGVATTTPGVMTPWPSESDEAMTNREILAEACTKRRLSDLLERYCEEDRPLNKVNLATIFQNIGRLGMPRDCQDKIVAYLDAAWKKCRDEDLNARQIGCVISGFVSLTDSSQTRQLMATLTPKVIDCQEVMKAQDIARAFKGLGNMTASPEARNLLAALTLKVRKCDEELTKQMISDCISGVLTIGLSKSEEVIQFLVTMASEIKVGRGQLKKKYVEKMIHSVRKFGDAPEVTDLIKALEDRCEA